MDIKTPAWARDAVFYQVFPDRLARSGRVEAPGELEPWNAEPTTEGFKGGDLYGVVAHLDRLKRLGITALYLNPVFASASNHRYHTDDYFNVDPLLGGNEALRELLDEAHARDMRVVLDGDFNHSGRGRWPFHHVAENGIKSPYRDWFYLSNEVRSGARQLNPYPTAEQLAEMDLWRDSGEHRGARSRRYLGYEAWWDLPALPKINLDDAHARELILEVSEFWVRFGIDGWRLDVAEEVGADFWREFHARVRAVNPEAYLVAEVWGNKPEWLQGDMFDAFMNYPLTRAILGFAAQDHWDASQPVPVGYQGEDAVESLSGEGLWARVEELQRLNPPAVTAVQLNLLGSHDTPRARTLCGGDLDSIRLASLLQLTLPGAPCVYYGDEIGMQGAMDPLCRWAFPDDPAAWEREPYEWMADIIALRHSSRAFRDAELTLLGTSGAAVAYLRRDGDDAFVVVANAEVEPIALDLVLPLDASAAELVPLRGGSEGERSAALEGRSLCVVLPGRDGVVVHLSL
jgi:cyclomaltodextrinase